MEGLFFKKVELWVVLLVVLFGFVGAIAFGWLAVSHYRGEPQVGVLGSIAARVAGVPDLAIAVATTGPAQETKESRFPGKIGFIAAPADVEGDDGLLLLSHFDEASGRYVVDLVDLSDNTTLRRYAADISDINSRARIDPQWLNLARDKSPERYRMVHPLLMDDGGLVFQDSSPLVRIDACSNVVWTIDGVFHHSIELDADGNIWVPADIWPSSIEGTTANTADDSITQVSPDGRIIFDRSMAQILIENGMQWIIYGIPPFSEDPLHVNDIQPALADGPHWKKGDLFISLRNRSMLVLYRPSTNQILWHKQGPWVLQHDVNILSDHQISIFNNNSYVRADGITVTPNNELLVYDFESGQVSAPFKEAFAENEIRTVTEGRGTILPNGDLFVEESDYGRALRMDRRGRLQWLYVSGSSEGSNFVLGWSRFISTIAAQKPLLNIANKDCGT